jgi:hypothetical protein
MPARLIACVREYKPFSRNRLQKSSHKLCVLSGVALEAMQKNRFVTGIWVLNVK